MLDKTPNAYKDLPLEQITSKNGKQKWNLLWKRFGEHHPTLHQVLVRRLDAGTLVAARTTLHGVKSCRPDLCEGRNCRVLVDPQAVTVTQTTPDGPMIESGGNVTDCLECMIEGRPYLNRCQPTLPKAEPKEAEPKEVDVKPELSPDDDESKPEVHSEDHKPEPATHLSGPELESMPPGQFSRMSSPSESEFAAQYLSMSEEDGDPPDLNSAELQQLKSLFEEHIKLIDDPKNDAFNHFKDMLGQLDVPLLAVHKVEKLHHGLMQFGLELLTVNGFSDAATVQASDTAFKVAKQMRKEIRSILVVLDAEKAAAREAERAAKKAEEVAKREATRDLRRKFRAKYKAEREAEWETGRKAARIGKARASPNANANTDPFPAGFTPFLVRLSPAELDKIVGVLQQHASALNPRYGPEEIAYSTIKGAITTLLEPVPGFFDRAQLVTMVHDDLRENGSRRINKGSETEYWAARKVSSAARAMHDMMKSILKTRAHETAAKIEGNAEKAVAPKEEKDRKRSSSNDDPNSRDKRRRHNDHNSNLDS